MIQLVSRNEWHRRESLGCPPPYQADLHSSGGKMILNLIAAEAQMALDLKNDKPVIGNQIVKFIPLHQLSQFANRDGCHPVNEIAN